MSGYFLKNGFPIGAEVLFIIAAVLLPSTWLIYISFLFYALVLGYFVTKSDFSLSAWQNAEEEGESFWIPVLLTVLALLICFLFTGMLESRFPDMESGHFQMAVDSWLELILFAITAMVLTPLAEELFYRRSLISFHSPLSLIITVLLSLLLYSLEHGVNPLGILTTVIWGLPLTVSYVRTRNFYIPLTAHFIANRFRNGLTRITLINFQLPK